MEPANYTERLEELTRLLLWYQRKPLCILSSRQRRLIALGAIYLKERADQEVENRSARRWWVRPINQRRRDQGDGENLNNEMRFLDVDVHFNYCRMNTEGFEYLLRLVGPLIQKKQTIFRDPIPASTRLYLTLRFLATGDNMTSIAYAFRIGHSTVSTIISETCQCIWDVLQSEIFVPSQENWKKVAKEFNDRWNFPHCIGAIDGKHVIIKAPPDSGSTFYNYKGSHSLNLMAISSASYQFLLVDIGAEGRHSDGGVFKNSSIGQLFAANAIHVPSPCAIVENGELMPYVLVADEAFQLTNYMMRPYPGKTLTESQRIFNYRLSRARRVIENAFGIMVARWRIFCGPLNTSLSTSEKIIKACVVLHNFCMNKPQFSSARNADTNLINDSNFQPMRGIGSNTHSRDAAKIRDSFKNYFLHEGLVHW